MIVTDWYMYIELPIVVMYVQKIYISKEVESEK